MIRGSRVRRWLLAALALVVGLGSLRSALALAESLRDQVEEASALGVLTPALEADLRRAESPVRARLHLARALLGAAVEEGAAGDGSGGTAAAQEQLEAAAELARSVLAEHPASWEAAALAGAATYLRWSQVRDPRLLQEYRRWEQPLLHALELAPDHRYPGRYLAAAYLELWPALSPEKRTLTRDLVASAFTDHRAFAQLLDPWLRVAGGDAALETVPDRPWAWAALRSRAGSRGDWSAYCEAWRRERRALSRELRARLVEAANLAAGGELGRARGELLAVVAAAPVEAGFAPVVERALRLLPHGPGRGTPSAPAERWLAWAMDQELLGAGHPLSDESLTRLRSLAFPGASATPAAAALSAWVELARDRPDRAREIAARAEGRWQPTWAPYHLLEARFQLERGRPELARQALRQVHPDWHGHPVSLRLAERLGERRTEAPENGPARTSAAGALDWRYAGAAARLALDLPSAAGGLRVTLAEVPAPGAALELRWDGASLGCRPVSPATGRLEVSVEPATAVHQLELEALAGGRVYPGSVELLPPPPRRRRG